MQALIADDSDTLPRLIRTPCMTTWSPSATAICGWIWFRLVTRTLFIAVVSDASNVVATVEKKALGILAAPLRSRTRDRHRRELILPDGVLVLRQVLAVPFDRLTAHLGGVGIVAGPGPGEPPMVLAVADQR